MAIKKQPKLVLQVKCPANQFGHSLECAFECCESLQGDKVSDHYQSRQKAGWNLQTFEVTESLTSFTFRLTMAAAVTIDSTGKITQRCKATMREGVKKDHIFRDTIVVVLTKKYHWRGGIELSHLLLGMEQLFSEPLLIVDY